MIRLATGWRSKHGCDHVTDELRTNEWTNSLHLRQNITYCDVKVAIVGSRFQKSRDVKGKVLGYQRLQFELQ